jgi:hypothetical protein
MNHGDDTLSSDAPYAVGIIYPIRLRLFVVPVPVYPPPISKNLPKNQKRVLKKDVILSHIFAMIENGHPRTSAIQSSPDPI